MALVKTGEERMEQEMDEKGGTVEENRELP